jgi:superfamily II DNA or RNA helicase
MWFTYIRQNPSMQVLVMTAQILLNILRHSIIKMDAIHLLILDECHHAVKKHPYSLVMSEFYHTTPKDKRPVVFGMTASPVNLKGTALLYLSCYLLCCFMFRFASSCFLMPFVLLS